MNASESRGMGVPGGMVKISEFVVVRMPFPRQVFPVAEPTKDGKLRTRFVVRYMYGGQWLDADTLLTRWQPWRDIVIEPSRTVQASAVKAEST